MDYEPVAKIVHREDDGCFHAVSVVGDSRTRIMLSLVEEVKDVPPLKRTMQAIKVADFQTQFTRELFLILDRGRSILLRRI